MRLTAKTSCRHTNASYNADAHVCHNVISSAPPPTLSIPQTALEAERNNHWVHESGSYRRQHSIYVSRVRLLSFWLVHHVLLVTVGLELMYSSYDLRCTLFNLRMPTTCRIVWSRTPDHAVRLSLGRTAIRLRRCQNLLVLEHFISGGIRPC